MKILLLQGGYHPISAAVDRADLAAEHRNTGSHGFAGDSGFSLSLGNAFFHSPPLIRPLLTAIGLTSQRKVRVSPRL